ncbi:MAG TPA: hypothetical protein VG871_14500 [Vicinamibacterales bacterium]|nr:hypothetical protein [Vicinamibacterales bacterium]
MRVRRLLAALTLALPAVPLCVLAQSSSPTPQCQRSCVIDYEDRVDKCTTSQDRDTCYRQASLAYQTCLSICH